jgi:hypothetical protein
MKIKASTIRMQRRMQLLNLTAELMAGEIKSAQGLPITTWTQIATLFLVHYPEGITPADLSTAAIKESITDLLDMFIANVRKSKLDVAEEAAKILVAIPRQKKSGSRKRSK